MNMKSAWIDLRNFTAELATAVVEESAHLGVEAIVFNDPDLAAKIPRT